MADDELVVHYKLLPKHNPDDPTELRVYDCSECDNDIFNINVHSQVEHGTHLFDIDHEEYVRPVDPPFHPCGILGCTFDANHPEGEHSWKANNA